MPSWIFHDYRCPAGHMTESLQDRANVQDVVPCERCNEPASKTISAVRGFMPVATVKRGPNDEKPPYVRSTEALGNGEMTPTEWREQRLEDNRRRVHQEVKDDFGMGKNEWLKDLRE